MSCCAEMGPQLRAQGLRMTPQRMAILHVLRHEGGHLSPTQVFDKVKRELPGITEPTVYRTLEHLAQKRFVLAAQMGHGRMVYELAEASHHHLVCRACGRTVVVEHAALGRLYKKLESSTGFRLEAGSVTFFGLCPECQPN